MDFIYEVDLQIGLEISASFEFSQCADELKSRLLRLAVEINY